ncbi:MAG: hypothetical protein Q7O66_16785 [Dehalococcoidia bacterium]|nr:hypothetical protein [Dehalococcoidia bacterium]
MPTYHVLCGMPGPQATNTVSVQSIEAVGERQAAIYACERFRWLTVKVGPTQTPIGELWTTRKYRANGRRV